MLHAQMIICCVYMYNKYSLKNQRHDEMIVGSV